MALRYMDGFDIYADATDVRKGGYERSGTAASSTFSTTNGRYGGGCLQGTGTTNLWVRALNALNGTTIYVSFAYYWSTPAAVSDNIFQLVTPVNGNVVQIRFNSTTTGNIALFNTAGTSIATASAALPSPATWYRIEIKIVLGTSTSTGAYEVRVNGSTVMSGSAVNIWGGTADSHTGRLVLGGTATGYRLDDLVVNDGTGSTLNGFLGDVKIETLIPTAKSNTSQWSGSITDVDDALAAPDGDTTFISSATSGDESLFKFSVLADRPTTIHALQQRTYCRSTDATSVKFKPVCDMRENRSLGNSQGAPLQYAWRRANVLETDPAGNTWAYETVRDARFGVRID